jgi:hypothetical protein
MTSRLIVGVVALLCIIICGLSSTIWGLEMVDKVNEKLSEQERFDHLWWDFSKRLRLNREYRRLYPDGPLLVRTHVAAVVMLLCGLVLAWGVGFFGK